MTDEEFDEFLDRAQDELERKQESLTQSYGFGLHQDFWFDQSTGRLQLKDSNGQVKVEADVTLIGSFSPSAGTWQWAWANQSIVEPLRRKSERFKELEAITGMKVFTAPAFEAEPEMAWGTVAMCVSHLGALGCYRMPSQQLEIFAAIDSVRAL